jgi:hypothetical protein
MNDISMIQSKNVYFLYRPKIEHSQAHELNNVQNFEMILKPENWQSYIVIIIGKKIP